MNKNKISSLIKLLSLMLFFLYNVGEAKQLEKVSVQFHWLDQFEFAGFYMAKEKGYYKDIDLDVEFKNYKYGINITEEVESGNSTFGVGGSDLIINISNNKKIKLLYATFQSSPLVLLTTPMSGIKSIKDFKNKRIMITPDVASSVTFNAMMKKENLNINDLKVQEHSFNVNDLIVQKTDLFQSYISNEPYILKEQGIKPIIFDPKDYGFDFYCDIIFTSDNEIKNNKQRALNFKEATLKGWQYAFNNIDETVNIILEKYNSQNKTYDALKYEANTLKQMAYENNQPLGNISLNKIQRMYDAYNIMNLIENEIDLEKIIVKDTVNYEVLLSKEEKDYLHQKGVITMCIDPQLMPFEGFDKSGNHIGISADYFKLFQKYVDIPIKIIKTSSWNETLEFLKQRKCDIVSLSMATQERKGYLNFTDTYVETPLILASRLNTYFIDDFSILKNEKIGITKGYGFIDIIKQKYPNLNIIEVQNIEDGLQQVSDGKIFGYIGALGSIGYMFQKEFMGEIKVAGKLDETLKLSIGVRNDDDSLLKIFDKLVKGIDTSTKQKILNSWLAVKDETRIDYTMLWQVLIISSIFILGLLYYQKKLYQLNNVLGEKIKDAIEENRKKDNLIFHQNKMATIGEMVGNIAHQWRQPLAKVSMIQNYTLSKLNNNPAVEKDILDEIKDSQKSLQFMSETINTFQNMYGNNNIQDEIFEAKNATERVLDMLKETLHLNSIIINKKYDNELLLKGNLNSFAQIILAILQNSIYFLKIRDIQKSEIVIKIIKFEEKVKIIISDNAGGTENKNIDKIFDYGFSVRDNNKSSTGIGLYISKLITKEKFNGEIFVRNIEKGLEFTILLPTYNHVN